MKFASLVFFFFFWCLGFRIWFVLFQPVVMGFQLVVMKFLHLLQLGFQTHVNLQNQATHGDGLRFSLCLSVSLGHDRGDLAAGTCQRNGWSSPGDGRDRRGSFFYFYGFGFVFWESNRAEGGRGNEKWRKW